MISAATRADRGALERAPELGFNTFVLSAPTPFARADAAELKRDAAAVIACLFPDAPALYAAPGWTLPATIGRVYDAGHRRTAAGVPCAHRFRRNPCRAARKSRPAVRARPFVCVTHRACHRLADPSNTSALQKCERKVHNLDVAC